MRAVVIALLVVPSVALADDDPLEQRRHRVGASHGLFAGTALTTPEQHGDAMFRVGDDNFALTTIAMGATPKTEVWADGGMIFQSPENKAAGIFTIGMGVKRALGRGRQWQVAGTAAVRTIQDDRDRTEEMDADKYSIASGGVVGTVCSSACGVMLSGSLGVSWIRGVVPMATASISIGLPDDLFELADIVWFDVEAITVGDSAVGFGGVHLAGAMLGLDLGVLVFVDDVDFIAMPFGGTVPFAGFSIRI